MVLGNSGSRRALPEIARFLTIDSDPILRAAAVSALRFISGEQIDSLLVKALKSDDDVAVRIEAVFILRLRPASSLTYTAQKESLSTDSSVDVRVGLLQNLWKVRGSFPDVIKLVTQVASRDASPDVRKVAQGLLPNGRVIP